MTRPLTDREIQRVTFVESLYNSLKKQAAEAIGEQGKFVVLASSYRKDGLEDSECIELLMIDGLSREAAESYVSMIDTGVPEVGGGFEYSFQFEDADGKRWSSYDINKTVRAATEDEAWGRAEDIIDKGQLTDPGKIISVTRIS